MSIMLRGKALQLVGMNPVESDTRKIRSQPDEPLGDLLGCSDCQPKIHEACSFSNN